MNKRFRFTHRILFGLLTLLISVGAASGVSVTVLDTTIQTGNTFHLPVRVDQVKNLGILAYQFTLNFDADVLNPIDVSIDGCLGGLWEVPTVNMKVRGEVTVVRYGVDPLTGAGPLVKIECLVVGNPGDTSALRFSSFTFNEGDPQAQISDPAAVFTVTSTGVPILSVFPETLEFGEVDTVEFITIVNVGVDSLEWNIREEFEIPWVTSISPSAGTDNEVVTVTVSREGLSAGDYDGVLKVSSNGGNKEIGIRMAVPQEHLIVDVFIPDTSQYKSRRVELPVRVGDVTEMGIIAYEFTLAYDASVINIVGATTDHSLSEKWGDPDVNTDTTGHITVFHFGDSTLVGYGCLLSLICFAVGNPGDSTDVTLNRFIFNDGYPFANWRTPAAIFSVDTADVPLLFLSPTVLDFGSVETVKMFDILNLGIKTLLWSVREDPDEVWITSVIPFSGSGEGTITVAVSRIGLPAGLYSGKISVTSNGGDGNITLSISVPGGERRVRLALQDTVAAIQSEITIPVIVNDVTSFGIIDFEFDLTFDQHVVEVLDALSLGTLSAPWGSPDVDLSQPGRAIVTHQGLLPLTGSGTLVGLRVEAVGNPKDSTELVFSNVFFNGNDAVAQYETPAGIFTVERPDHPLLSVSPVFLDFGLHSTSKTISINNIGIGTLHWSVFESPEVEWITSVYPPDGSGQGSVTVTVSRVGRIPEEYTGAVYVASNGGYENVRVRMVVEETDTVPPYVAFNSPQTGAVSVARNGPIYIVIEDLDSDVDAKSVYVVVDSDTIVSKGLDRTGGAVHFLQKNSKTALIYTPQEPFDENHEVIIAVRAEDTAFPHHLFAGSFSYTTGVSLVEVSTRATLGSEGGTVTDTNGVLVTLPSAVLKDSLVIFLGPVTVPPPLPDTLVSVGKTYLFGPDGFEFCPLPGVGRLVYTENDLDSAGVTDPFQLMVFGFNSGAGQWEEQEVLNIDPETKAVLFHLCRLGYMALGISKSTSVESNEGIGPIPHRFLFLPNWPNPFNSSTDIPFEIPFVRSSVNVTIDVYNVVGENIRCLFKGCLRQGYYSVTWDGRDRAGRDVPTGIYFSRMIVIDSHRNAFFQQTRKMLFLK